MGWSVGPFAAMTRQIIAPDYQSSRYVVVSAGELRAWRMEKWREHVARGLAGGDLPQTDFDDFLARYAEEAPLVLHWEQWEYGCN